MRSFVVAVLGALTAVAATAHAQPAQPAPPPAPTPNAQDAPVDPVLAEQVAQSLVVRAQELVEAKQWVDAKQLAIEAIVRSPKGPAAEQARAIVKTVDHELGVPAEPAPAGPSDQPPGPPPPPPPPPPPLPPATPGDPRTAAWIHGGLLGGALGATIGTAFSNKPGGQVGGAIPLGLAGAAGAAYGAGKLVDKLGWSEAQVRTVGAGSVWGGVIGGLVADIATGLHGTTARQVLIGSSIGGVVGGAAGAGLASRDRYTRGDVALIDTLAGMGCMGGFALGMIMQPAESEAYSLNAIVGTAAGVVIGLVAAPETNTTPRRMARVAGLAALGAGLPFLLYAAIYSSTSSADERLVGLLSAGGMVGGAYLGFRLTDGMDAGLDTKDGRLAAPPQDTPAPPALVTRSGRGAWDLGTVVVQPLSRTLDDRQRGTAVSLVGVAW